MSTWEYPPQAVFYILSSDIFWSVYRDNDIIILPCFTGGRSKGVFFIFFSVLIDDIAESKRFARRCRRFDGNGKACAFSLVCYGYRFGACRHGIKACNRIFGIGERPAGIIIVFYIHLQTALIERLSHRILFFGRLGFNFQLFYRLPLRGIFLIFIGKILRQYGIPIIEIRIVFYRFSDIGFLYFFTVLALYRFIGGTCTELTTVRFKCQRNVFSDIINLYNCWTVGSYCLLRDFRRVKSGIHVCGGLCLRIFFTALRIGIFQVIIGVVFSGCIASFTRCVDLLQPVFHFVLRLHFRRPLCFIFRIVKRKFFRQLRFPTGKTIARFCRVCRLE